MYSIWTKVLDHLHIIPTGSCSALVTHATKLSVHSFCADVNAVGSLELCSH